MTLQAFLLSIVGGSVVLGPIIFLLLEKQIVFAEQTIFAKRLIVAACAGALGVAAWGLAAFLGYVPVPVTNPDWAEAFWSNGVMTAYAAFVGATFTHGIVKTMEATATIGA